MHFSAAFPIIADLTSTRANRVFCFTYSRNPLTKNNAAVNTAMVVKSIHIGAFCSTRPRTSGAIYNCVKFSNTSRIAVSAQNNRTRFLISHAIFTIQLIFWTVLYFGFSLLFILPHLTGYHDTKIRPRIIWGTNRYSWVMNCRFHTCGSSISVVNAPSSLLRLIYPSSRSTIASIRTRPNPCPSPLVLRNSEPSFFILLPAVKLVNEM